MAKKNTTTRKDQHLVIDLQVLEHFGLTEEKLKKNGWKIVDGMAILTPKVKANATAK